jgi:hypothetical protein
MKTSETDEDLEIRLRAHWLDYLGPNAIRMAHRLAILQARFVVQTLRRGRSAAYQEYIVLLDAMYRSANCQSTSSTCFDSSLIVVSPHLGFSKLMSEPFRTFLNSFGINLGNALPHEEPWIWRHLPAWSIARRSDAAIVPIEMQYGQPIQDIQSAYGAIALDLSQQGLVKDLVQRMDSSLRTTGRIVFSIFPEGGSTGKRDGKGRPFRLESFHSGFAIAAQQLRLRIVPVAHVVDPNGCSHFGALEPVYVEDSYDLQHWCNSLRTSLQLEMRRLLAKVVRQPDSHS